MSIGTIVLARTIIEEKNLQRVEPYSFGALQRYAAETVAGRFPNTAPMAIGSTLLLTMLCLLVASKQMERHEL